MVRCFHSFDQSLPAECAALWRRIPPAAVREVLDCRCPPGSSSALRSQLLLGAALVAVLAIFSHYTQPAQTYSYDFETGQLINQTRSSAHEEPEGLFPDDRFSAMEADRHVFDPDEPDYDQPIRSDIYMLRLDGTGKTSYRLTQVSAQPERWANNPNVRGDGCAIAYSIGVGPATTSHASGRFGGVEVIEFHECSD